MGIRLRLGRFSVSSRGRVGARAGPVTVYGGGRRRRRSKTSSGGDSFLALVVLALFVAFWVALVWLVSLLGHAVGLMPSWHELLHHGHVWMHAHYPLVGLRYVIAVVVPIAVLVAFRRMQMRRGSA